MSRRRQVLLAVLTAFVLCPWTAWAGGGALPDNDIVMRALSDEMNRSLEKLELEGLPKPYFIQYTAEDRLMFQMEASYGALESDDTTRRRYATSRVRVGSHELDNTNFGPGFGAAALLPIDDDYTAIRHAVWRMTDGDYVRALEMLTRKEAFLREKNVPDRPADYTKADCAAVVEKAVEVSFDEAEWKARLRRLSAHFERYPRIQNSGVRFFAGAVHEWVVNSEDARLRTGDSGVIFNINARMQAEDGMALYDSVQYLGEDVSQLPPEEQMIQDVDKMCDRLMALADAPILEQYTGPVLFEPVAAGKVFAALMADGLAGRPEPLGRGGFDETSLEKKIGLRVLPRSFQVYDDPTAKQFNRTFLIGNYEYDDEAVPAQRVSLVENGILQSLVMGRAPTKKVSGSTGHARTSGFGDPRAHVGCLFFEDEDGVPAEELKAELIQTAKEEGLEFGLRIADLAAGRNGELGDPLYAYKVYVEDGREELVRGMQFRPVNTRALKRILAAGQERDVYNDFSDVSFSVISPSILMEELDLVRTEREFDKLPLIKSPIARGEKPSS